MFLFVDVETTGLNPNGDYLLELGMVLTTDGLLEVDSFERVIKPEVWSTWARRGRDSLKEYLPVEVFKMHDRNGLIDELSRGIHVRQAEDEALQWLEVAKATELPMAGSTVHFDRAFLKLQMPRLEQAFHYRNIDVSTIKGLAQKWNKPIHDSRPTPSALHRALPDVRDTISELNHYRGKWMS